MNELKEELKTLKDIGFDRDHFIIKQTRDTDYIGIEELEKNAVSKIYLKQEAIKWIKEFQKERTDAISEMFDNVDRYGIYPTTKFFNRIDNFWKNKFNIKGEI